MEYFIIISAKLGTFQNGIFQKESFRIYFLAKAESFRMESFRKNLSERVIQKESFRNDFFDLKDSSWFIKSFVKRFLLKDSFLKDSF
jgi:hypothetical protein